MKTFDEAVRYVMSLKGNLPDKFAYTQDILNHRSLVGAFTHGMEHLVCCEQHVRVENAISAVLAGFEMGMAVGMEMEKTDVEKLIK